jgi:proteasome lid subunit RPN8/RPN11
MNSDFLDMSFGLPGRRNRHPAPPDDYRLADATASESSDIGARNLTDKEPAEESSNTDIPGLWVMKITQSAYRDMLDYLRARRPEAAGILLGPVEDDLLVTHFVPDSDGKGSAASFQIDAAGLNRTLKRVKPAGVNGKGLAHSHPSGVFQPSSGDLMYLEKLFGLPANAAAQQCFMPIVCDRRVYPYVYARGRLWVAELILV